jgi:hypothetical protein
VAILRRAYPRGNPRLKPQATSPRFVVGPERAKAKALAYLEARAKAINMSGESGSKGEGYKHAWRIWKQGQKMAED